MDTRTLSTLLENYCHITNIHYYDETDSTNLRAKQYVQENDGTPAYSPCLFVSEVQTAGRGRLGRSWESPPNEGIWMSYLCKPNLSPDQISGVTILAGLAVAKAINSFALKQNIHNLYAEIKWPNDIVINKKKVCGILSEGITDLETGLIQHAIVGIGLNVRSTEFPEELESIAGSLQLSAPTRNEIVGRITGELLALYQDLDSKEYLQEYLSHSMHPEKVMELLGDITG